MACFLSTFIDDLRLQANIVQVVQEYVPLKTRGHDATRASARSTPRRRRRFTSIPTRGSSTASAAASAATSSSSSSCTRRSAFPDAVRMLAQKFGVAAARDRATSGDDGRGAMPRLREALLKVHEIAAAYFREQLAGAGGRAGAPAAARTAASRRQTVEQLGLGFAPPARDGLKARLLEQGFAQALLLQSGLVVQRDERRGRRPVPQPADGADLPRHRLGHRLRRPGDGPRSGRPKYLNSPETPIYSKGRTLYGLNLTKAAIRKLGYAVLVEGYFDFAQVFQAEAAPVVASCGTALTAAAGAAAAALHVEGRPQLRPGRRRAGRGRPVVRAAGRRRASTSTSWCWTGARIPTRSSAGTGADAVP